MKRRFAFALTLCLLGLALLGLLAGSTGVARASDLVVCPAGPPECLYDSIQDAVDDASDGDLIQITSGVYTGVNTYGGSSQVVLVTKTVTIRGGYNADLSEWDPALYSTTLDAGGQGRVIYISGESSPTIEGLHITGGKVEAPLAGGGILVSSALTTALTTISHNQIYSNAADSGGGLCAQSARVTITNNKIYSNTATWGGGLGLRDATSSTLGQNTIISNVADFGGGLISSGTITITGNRFSHNLASQDGGGLSLGGGEVWLEANTILSNTAGGGGGLDLDGGQAILVNNMIAGNQALTEGCGLSSHDVMLLMLHNTVARNLGPCSAGLYLGERSTVAMTDTILVSHTLGLSITAGNTATLEATLWGTATWANQTDWGGAGTISTGTVNVRGEPGFVDPDGGDYHIAETSAAKDVGIDAGVSTDIDGQSRPRDGGFDLGADEFHPVFYRFLPRVAHLYSGIPKLLILDQDGVEQDEEWLQETFGAVEISRTAPGPAYRACVFKEIEGPATQVIKVTEDDEPLPGTTVIRTWPDAPPLPPDLVGWDDKGIAAQTDHKGEVGWGMGFGDYYFPPAGGASSVWIADAAIPSDLVRGLGMLGGTNHIHLDVEYCLTR